MAGSHEDCQKSPACKVNGQCGATKEGTCVARNDADCQKSAACVVHVKCKAQGGQCVAAKPRK